MALPSIVRAVMAASLTQRPAARLRAAPAAGATIAHQRSRCSNGSGVPRRRTRDRKGARERKGRKGKKKSPSPCVLAPLRSPGSRIALPHSELHHFDLVDPEPEL